MTETLPISPSAFAEWMPFAKALGFFFGTFVLEDVAAVGAGLLLASGGISWPAAFIACFVGIWLGDAGLYALARWAGRGWFERSSLRRFAARVTESEQWFARRGTAILIFSRLVPGARLPTYLAAGFLRVPLPRFLLITGAASCAWTLAILLLAQTLGARLTAWLGTFKHTGLLILGIGILAFTTLRLLRRVLAQFNFRGLMVWLHRWRHWEFWPAWMFYPPVVIYYAWLAIKYRGATLPTAANPGMFSGGMVGESKAAILEELFQTSPEFTCEAKLIGPATPAKRLLGLDDAMARLQLDYPFILKPNVGQRGVGVKMIRNVTQAENYLLRTDAELILQRYASGPHEVGIFYYRFPHEPRGHIFAITEKIFPVLTGDGKRTVAELIHTDPRARFMADKYLQRLGGRATEIPAAGAAVKLVEAGNHAQGCIFQDGMRLCTPELVACIDEISQKLDGFFIGRFDIRYAAEEDLRAGRNFQIIELNGAASEATSVYDARNSLWNAYRTLFAQWELVFAIGAANRRAGCRPTPPRLLWRKWREYGRLAATYPLAD